MTVHGVYIRVGVAFFAFALMFTTSKSADSQVDYSDTNCIVDPSLEAKVKDNYVNCQTREMKDAGKTTCCAVQGEKGCCNPNGEWTELILICVGIGVTSSVIAALCFYKLWCDDQSMPCLITCRKRARAMFTREQRKPTVRFAGKPDMEIVEEDPKAHVRPVPIPMPVHPTTKRALMWGTEM